MNVIYNTCYADPWLQVAISLQREYGFNPVYWNGYHDDNSEDLIKTHFPTALYHRYYDAWKGVFPDPVHSLYAESHIELDFLKKYAYFELQTLKMMDRMDITGHGFSFIERQRHYRNFVKYWSGCIGLLKPELVISAVVPHRVYDYVLYLLCHHHGIPYISFRSSIFKGRIVPLTDVSTIGNIFDAEYKKCYQNASGAKELWTQIDSNIYETYLKVQKSYAEGQPEYMHFHYSTHKKNDGFAALFKTLLSDIRKQKKLYFGSEGQLLKGINYYHKHPLKSIENSRFSFVSYSRLKLKTNNYKKSLKKYYHSKAVVPDYEKPYVILPLHYQPEMTSNPSGDIFVDQMLCVDVLDKHLPPDFTIYVKEHPVQFQAHREGHTSRIKEFYDDLLRYKRVKLVPLNIDSFTLIRNSIAIATVTGTAGWEGMVLGKPVIIFGLAWYEKYSGVLRITDDDSASAIPAFIENYVFDEKNLAAYLAAFDAVAVKAYFYKGLKQKMNQSEQECVENLKKAVIKMLENGKI